MRLSDELVELLRLLNSSNSVIREPPTAHAENHLCLISGRLAAVSGYQFYNMNWYFVKAGGHIKVRVFVNGALCGHLAFRDEEFESLFKKHYKEINFISDGPLEAGAHQDFLKKLDFSSV